MLITFIRTIIMYFFVVLTLRLIGKRQIGELEPSELVVTIVISEVASLPIQDTSQPIANSLIAIFLLLILEVIISFSAYKSFDARKFFYGKPSVFYEKGHINQSEMEKQRFNINDLMEVVRNNGAVSLDEVEYVIMETNGNVSVIPNEKNKPLTAGDMNINAEPPQISYVIVDNGKINRSNLKRLGYNDDWLDKQLAAHRQKLSDVFCMTADRSGTIVMIPISKKKGSDK